MKKLLFLFLPFMIFQSMYSENPPFVSRVMSFYADDPGTINRGDYPLVGGTYKYKVVVSEGKAGNAVARCTNGVFENGTASIGITTGTNSTIKVKWTNVGPGSVVISNDNGDKVYYDVRVDPITFKINGPNVIKYNSIGEYRLEANPNITFVTAKWTCADGLQQVGGGFTAVAQIKAIENRPRVIKNGIKVVLHTDKHGSLTQYKDVEIEPVLSIQSTSDIVCANQNVTYSINGYFSGATVVWQALSNATLVSQATSQATFRSSGNGLVGVKAVVSYNGKNYLLENSKVWVGPPSTLSINGDYNLSTSSSYMYKIDPLPTANEPKYPGTYAVTEWIVSSPLKKLSSTDKALRVSTPSLGKNTPFVTAYITALAKNVCGTANITRQVNIVNGNYGGGGLEERSLPVSSTSTESPQSVKIYSFATGYLLYQEKNVTNFNIQNTNLNPDIYILEITDSEGNTTRQKVAKNNY